MLEILKKIRPQIVLLLSVILTIITYITYIITTPTNIFNWYAVGFPMIINFGLSLIALDWLTKDKKDRQVDKQTSLYALLIEAIFIIINLLSSFPKSIFEWFVFLTYTILSFVITLLIVKRLLKK
jgi:peptidoglycan/LPS O-acetylase OafA/YrhL